MNSEGGCFITTRWRRERDAHSAKYSIIDDTTALTLALWRFCDSRIRFLRPHLRLKPEFAHAAPSMIYRAAISSADVAGWMLIRAYYDYCFKRNVTSLYLTFKYITGWRWLLRSLFYAMRDLKALMMGCSILPRTSTSSHFYETLRMRFPTDWFRTWEISPLFNSFMYSSYCYEEAFQARETRCCLRMATLYAGGAAATHGAPGRIARRQRAAPYKQAQGALGARGRAGRSWPATRPGYTRAFPRPDTMAGGVGGHRWAPPPARNTPGAPNRRTPLRRPRYFCLTARSPFDIGPGMEAPLLAADGDEYFREDGAEKTTIGQAGRRPRARSIDGGRWFTRMALLASGYGLPTHQSSRDLGRQSCLLRRFAMIAAARPAV